MSDLLSSISVFIVFLGFLLALIEKDVVTILKKTKPPIAQQEALNRHKKEVCKTLFLKAIPIALVFIITSYSLLPKATEIVMNSHFEIWSFDTLNTIFIFIEFGLLGLSVYAIINVVQLIKHIENKG